MSACLKILPAEQIVNLKFPPPSNSPIRLLYYKKLNLGIGNLRASMSRHELFTGNQTMEEREESYKVCRVYAVGTFLSSGMQYKSFFLSKDFLFIQVVVNEMNAPLVRLDIEAIIPCHAGE